MTGFQYLFMKIFEKKKKLHAKRFIFSISGVDPYASPSSSSDRGRVTFMMSMNISMQTFQ